MVSSKWNVTGRLAVLLVLVAALLSPSGASPSPSAALDDLDLDDLDLDDPQLEDGLEAVGAVGTAEAAPPHEDEHVGEVMLSGHVEPTVAQKETDVYRLVSSAMRQPSLRRQLSQILPIVRAMTPAQRLALAAMKLLLPLSWDIANLITASAAEADGGRLLRAAQEFHAQTYTYIIIAAASTNIIYPGENRLLANTIYNPESTPSRNTSPVPPPVDLPPPPGNNRRNGLVTTGEFRICIRIYMCAPQVTREQHQQQIPTTFRPSPARPQHRLETADNDPEPQSCNLVANDLCLETDDYPDSAILASIRRSQGSMDAMLLDSGQRSTSPTPTADRRPDSPLAAALTSSQTSESGTVSLCASRTQLARPRRARATSGQWKFVVNVGEYTQTLRLDLCLKPRESCGLLPDNVESRCQQVYNYHRLLTWDNERGLHMDIFKVPTCCTCQVTAVHPLLQRPSKQPTQQQQQTGAKHHDVDNDADAAAVVPSRLPSITTPSSAPTTPPPSFLPTRHGFRRPSTHPVTGSPGYLPPRGPPLPLADHGGADVDSRLSWLKRNRSSLYNRYPPRRPKPHVISSDSIRRGATTRQPQAPSPPTLPTPPDAATPSPDGLSVGAASGPHRRVNYSYHPIIDYIRQQQLAEQPATALQSRSGQGWTPIEGAAA
ncbi:uncharacterized protein LOC126419629 [Schistocerca serialis cubense]|uniref:uncharacterized protein LOC126419629 n=1 Tax=Schistocerca serialis cubense TaxID=2023355 RepID=UPI00214E2D12|nr:uncharacterized protein LOC126419629 [Schistocerca serialis cubense]